MAHDFKYPYHRPYRFLPYYVFAITQLFYQLWNVSSENLRGQYSTPIVFLFNKAFCLHVLKSELKKMINYRQGCYHYLEVLVSQELY